METCSVLLAICAGNSPVTGEIPAQVQWRRTWMFSLICAWINGWVNSREAGDLRRYRAHYDVTVISDLMNKKYRLMFGSKTYTKLSLRYLIHSYRINVCICHSRKISLSSQMGLAQAVITFVKSANMHLYKPWLLYCVLYHINFALNLWNRFYTFLFD